MKLHKHFLPQDMVQASKEFHSFKSCLELTHIHVRDGNLDLANERSIDMLKSLHQLTELSKKKNEVERRNGSMEQMGVAGVHVQVVRMLKHE